MNLFIFGGIWIMIGLITKKWEDRNRGKEIELLGWESYVFDCVIYGILGGLVFYMIIGESLKDFIEKIADKPK